MKTLITFSIALLISISGYAQQGINYKAILKDTNGNLLAGTFMNVQFSIHQTSDTGPIVYQEDFNYTTDANGLLILNLGTDTTPSIGVFADIDWGADLHFLQTSITYSGGTINFDATQFMAVPYAKNAETANNVFSGDYNDLINQPTTIPTGLEQVTEYNPVTETTNSGWRLKGFNPTFYNPIGQDAVDLSEGNGPTNPTGASGINSFASGYVTEASGEYSIAMGYGSDATEYQSVAIGTFARASGFGSFAIGGGVTATDPSSMALGEHNEVITDALLMFGNGYNPENKSNALVVMRDGTITAPSLSELEIDNAGDKALITKEYVDAKLPIAYGIVESNGNILANTGNFIAIVSSGVFTIDVNDTESLSYSNTVCTITPISSLARTSSTLIADGNSDGDSDIIVRIFDANGNLAATTFQFVIYKQ